METKQLTIRVNADAARLYETASPEQQQKLNTLLSLKLSEATQTNKSLEDIMDEMSSRAQKRGLTPNVLDSILDGE